MNRHDELMGLIPDDSKELLIDVVLQMEFLEGQLLELKKLPFIQFNSKNPVQQRATPASKMYKEMLQQYLNSVKTIEAVIYRDKKLDDTEEESPLRSWFNAHK